MKTLKIRNNFLLVTLIIGAVIGLTALSGQSHNGSARQEETIKGKDEKKLPMAVYSASLPADSTARAQRLARNGRYNNRNTEPMDQWPATSRESFVYSEWYLYVPALPTADSDAIVLGNVVDAKGYLSNDKTGAYSEFTILVEEIFKDGRRSLIPRGSVVAEREGANVKLPDGRIIRHRIANLGTPQVGRRYVLFLKYNEQGNDYSILTGYELRNNLVFPLDEADHFAAYKKLDEEAFFNAVREALVNPPRAPRGNGG